MRVEPRRVALRALVLALGVVLLRGSRASAECSIAQLCPAGDPCRVTGTHALDDNCVLELGSRPVLVTGTIKAKVSGGSYAIHAGPFTVEGGALRAHGDNAVGGVIAVTADGPFVMSPSGPLLEADGDKGGGKIAVIASAITLDAGTISADGTAGAASGGLVVLMATGSAPLVIDASISSQGRGGADSAGGIVDVEGASLDVRATINTSGSGDDGGELDLTARDGDLTLTTSALVIARAGSFDASGGMGGAVELTAAGSIVVGGAIRTEGPGPDGAGGDVKLAADGFIRIDDLVTTEGTGTESDGGDIDIDAGTTVAINARLNSGTSGGGGSGGQIGIAATGDVTVAAGITVRSDGGLSDAGDVTITTRSVVRIDGSIIASANSGGDGGVIWLEGCSVTIDGTLDADASGGGSGGANQVRAATLTVGPTATLSASPPLTLPEGFLSTNTLELRAGVPTISPDAVITPMLDPHLVPSLTTCCGNATLDDGEVCDDGNRSDCDGCSAICLPEPPCPPDGNPCTRDCSPDLGCVYEPLTDTPCDGDGSACTTDVCFDGVCGHPAITCDDGVACTLDACDPATGCVATPDDASCDDGNDCTTDVCDPVGGCASTVRPDLSPCDDHDVCTTGDACLLGQCIGTGIPLSCDDGNPCTSDACDVHFGCVNTENPAACPCTVNGAPLAAGTPCADGNICTTPDTCDGAGHCVAGAVCDDGDPCTTDTCFLLCLHTDDGCPTSCAGLPDGTPCSDGAVCTVGACAGGACASHARDCGDEAACDGIDYCDDTLGCRSSYPPADDPRCFTTVLDAFGCYKARAASGTPRFAAVTGLPVASALESLPIDVLRPRGLCAPASYAGQDPLATLHDDHLVSYKTHPSAGAPPFARARSLVIQNRVGTLVVDTVGRERLLAPAAMSLGAPPGEPVPPNPDAFLCYKVGVSAGTPGFQPVRDVTIATRFGPARCDLVKPTHLCAPVDVANEDPSAAGHGTFLMCYKAKTVAGTTFLPRVVSTNDRFPPQTLYLTKWEEVCLPSLRVTVPPP